MVDSEWPSIEVLRDGASLLGVGDVSTLCGSTAGVTGNHKLPLPRPRWKCRAKELPYTPLPRLFAPLKTSTPKLPCSASAVAISSSNGPTGSVIPEDKRGQGGVNESKQETKPGRRKRSVKTAKPKEGGRKECRANKKGCDMEGANETVCGKEGANKKRKKGGGTRVLKEVKLVRMKEVIGMVEDRREGPGSSDTGASVAGRDRGRVASVAGQDRKVASVPGQDRKVASVAGQDRKVASVAGQDRRKVASVAGQDRRKVAGVAGQDRRKVASVAGQDRKKVASIAERDRGKVSGVASRVKDKVARPDQENPCGVVSKRRVPLAERHQNQHIDTSEESSLWNKLLDFDEIGFQASQNLQDMFSESDSKQTTPTPPVRCRSRDFPHDPLTLPIPQWHLDHLEAQRQNTESKQTQPVQCQPRPRDPLTLPIPQWHLDHLEAQRLNTAGPT